MADGGSRSSFKDIVQAPEHRGDEPGLHVLVVDLLPFDFDNSGLGCSSARSSKTEPGSSLNALNTSYNSIPRERVRIIIT